MHGSFSFNRGGGCRGRHGQRPSFRGNAMSLELVEAAVAKAKSELLSKGENVSTWKLSQSAALYLQAKSWDSLGFRFNEVPSLRSMQFVEGKVNAFIHCFVSTRRMTSVHELGIELCQSEGVEQFDELGLGPLLRHPLVQHYFLIPSDAIEVCKITVEELIGRLVVFQYKMKYKEFTVEEFLDFLVQKYSVDSREKLGVRIHSMGMYIKFIRKIKKAEDAAHKSIQESMLPKVESQELSSSIPEHFKSLTTLVEDCEGNCNIATGTVNDDNNDNVVSLLQSRKANKRQRHNSKKSVDDVDDMKLIGLKLAMFNYSNCGREPLENEEDLGNQGGPGYEIMQTNSAKAMKLTLTNYELERFIASWKGACQKHTVNEVLAMMIHIYKTSEKKKRKLERLFLSFPAVALLNIAVRFIKYGELSSLIEDLKENVSKNPSSEANMRCDDRHSTEGDLVASADENCTLKVGKNISVDDIIKQVATYFGLDQALKVHAVIHDCEIWLSKKFSVKDFKCLGHGCFVEFLRTHASLLPHELRYLITGDIQSTFSLEVSMLQQQFLAFLFQAARNMRDSSVITRQYIAILLKKQFPAISFQLTSNEPEGCFQDLIQYKGDFDIPTSVAFSAALSGSCDGSLFVGREEFGAEPSRMLYESVGALGSVSTTDAIQCLLKVPMLSDLQSWSHWHLIFAPSLGPLLEWLLNMGHIKELSCIVTSDGRIIRIDHSATLDEFFEASVLGSPFQAAVKLLSLFFVYDGSHNIPLALLKCYCQRAFDVTIKNYADKNEYWENIVQYRYPQGSIPCANDGCMPLFDLHCAGMELQVNGSLSEDLSQINKAHAAVAMFILECLGHLPSEFRSTAADILVSSLKFFTKDAALIMLCLSKATVELIMLHDIGLSLGIMEWIKDYQGFSSEPSADLSTVSGTLHRQSEHVAFLKSMPNMFPTDVKVTDRSESESTIVDGHHKEFLQAEKTTNCNEGTSNNFDHCIGSSTLKIQEIDGAAILIQKIRREEFGVDPDLENSESSLLKKQHARLGRALHCLSQELYSQDSHFILELVQNADDNIYPENVEATLAFILQHAGIVVLNNEQGFTDPNIRALCDVGSSTKKGSGAGYIGKKGIGFKSVFRVSDAPEIHSNGFHIKFDITEGQIGFILPTVIPPCNIGSYKEQVICDSDQSDASPWNTCIVLPFNSKIKSNTGISPIISMFSDLHPSLLLFLKRLKCIKFKNMIEDQLITMRREILKDGIIKVSHGRTQTCWLVVDKTMQASFVRSDVQTTKIAIAFTLQDFDDGFYMPDLDQQPVFAFLPLRNYGLKFILQGDFILPSSREEVDGDSAWNQWLLSEFPDLFVSAEKAFCSLPCFQECPGRAVTAFMSFVPLMGEVHGFFSKLPHMILSKLRLSNCLLLDGSNVEWVRPCRVLRNWNEQVRIFLPETVLQQQLGLGYLGKDIILPDVLAKALGIQEYGPKLLVELLSSISHCSDGIKLLQIDWLFSWLDALYSSWGSLSVHSSGYPSSATGGTELDLLLCLRQCSFIPLSDGSYGSLANGPIWLPFDVFNCKYEGGNELKHFPNLYAGLRTVNPLLFSPEATEIENIGESRVSNVSRMLCKIGVQQFSAHDMMRNHVLPSISADRSTSEEDSLMIEYLSFIMIHLQSACCNCNTERYDIICELRRNAVVSTDNGFKCPIKEGIHFSKEFGNSIDVKKLIGNTDITWNEVGNIYLNHPSTLSISNGLSKWRSFFQELGVTDFVQVIHVERNVANVLDSEADRISSIWNVVPSKLYVKDWESPELVQIFCALSSNKSLDACKYLLEILDYMWDDCFSLKARYYIPSQSNEKRLTFGSSFVKSIQRFKWVASSIDDDVHYPMDLFHDCESVRSILGPLAPYAVPKVTSKNLLEDVQFKVQVTLIDALRVIQYWRDSVFSASISQMSKFYTFIWDELSSSKERIAEVRKSISIFIPLVHTSNYMDVVSGRFMPPDTVFWYDPTGCLDRLQQTCNEDNSTSDIDSSPCLMLSSLYPGLHDFLVTDCGVLEAPPSCSYLKILVQLSRNNLPSQVAHEVLQVFLKLADDLKSGLTNSGEILGLKESLTKLENAVLPTIHDKWVSLHPHFGLVCWSDDDVLTEQCMHLNDVHILQMGELTIFEKEMLSSKVSALMQNIGVRDLKEVVSRDAIFYGIEDNMEVASLINWAFPYVQRYLYELHPEAYIYLKHCGSEKLAQLQVVAVETLFCRYSIKGHSTTNRKRHECSCLLQGSIFYTTPNVDTHSMFLELSRFFLHGIPEQQMANFLHMIANMAELGSSADQIEFFIVSIQKVPVLPDGEPLWSPSSLFAHNATEILSPTCSPFTMSKKNQLPKPAKKQLARTNWPHSNWKTAPDHFNSPSNVRVMEIPRDSSTFVHQEHHPIASDDIKDDHRTTEVGNELDIPSIFTERDKLCMGVAEEDQSHRTGRLGEMVAYKYFTEKLGPETEVRWVNEEGETGLPYDLIIRNGGRVEYVEVKSTASATKDWFPISTNEFHFASKKGDSFSVARVVLSGRINAGISVFKNPVKLCNENVLQLAVLLQHDGGSSI